MPARRTRPPLTYKQRLAHLLASYKVKPCDECSTWTPRPESEERCPECKWTPARRVASIKVPKRKSRSPLEDSFEQKLKDAGITGWERELTDIVPGRRFRADFGWPKEHLLVEVQGYKFHSGPASMRADYEKHALCTLNGWNVLYVMKDHVQNGDAITWVRALLGAS